MSALKENLQKPQLIKNNTNSLLKQNIIQLPEQENWRFGFSGKTHLFYHLDFDTAPKTDVKAAHFTLRKKLASKQKHGVHNKIRKYYKVDFLKIKSFMNSKAITPLDNSNSNEKEHKIKGIIEYLTVFFS